MNDAGRSVLVVILVLVALPLLWGTVMMGAMGPGMMGGGWGGWGGSDGWSPWRGLLGMLSTVLVVGGIAVVGWWAFGRVGGQEASGGAGSGARRVLDERYARGELTREQYQQMRSDLES